MPNKERLITLKALLVDDELTHADSSRTGNTRSG